MANATGGGRPPSTAREAAILAGDRTYYGAIHTRCGSSMRYTKGSGCVHCAKQATQDIRDAAKIVRLDLEERREVIEVRGDDDPVDIPDDARYEQDIDSLM